MILHAFGYSYAEDSIEPKLKIKGILIMERKGRYTRGVLLLEHAPGARSGSKASPCVPKILWVY